MPTYSLTTVFSDKMSKVLSKTSQVAFIQCLSLQMKDKGSSMGNKADQEEALHILLPLQNVFLMFEDVFQEPNGLPPCRLQIGRASCRERV